jgi:outer membrane protein assembly factor BamB
MLSLPNQQPCRWLYFRKNLWYPIRIAFANAGHFITKMKVPFVVTLIIAAVLTCGGFAQEPLYDVLATGSGRIVLFAPDFTVKWQHPAGNITEVHRLKNGNFLFADGTVKEVTPEHKIVFQYAPPEKKEGSFTCQRLPNGNTLIGENYSGIVREIAPDGSVAFELQTRFKTNDQHHRMRWVRKLPNGNYLVCHSGDHLVREYKANGESVWEYATPNVAFLAERLKNGNTIVSSLDRITEVDKNGKTVWEFQKSDLPQLHITSMCGFQILRNGNIVIGCYHAYNKDGTGVGMFEITRDKKLVWAYQKPTGDKIDMNMMGVEMQEPPAAKRRIPFRRFLVKRS